MSRWKIKHVRLDEREGDFTAEFLATNVDTEKSVTLTLQQLKGDPASDLIGALRAMAQLLENVSRDGPPAASSNVAQLS